MRHLIAAAVLGLACSAIAETWTVDDDGPADFDNIQAAVDAVQWQRAAYYDQNYTGTWATDQAMVDHLAYDGYQVLDANALKSWMDARIDDGEPSVVVFCQDVAPDTVAESMDPDCTLRRYLNAGGKIIWYGDIPLYYQGHADGTLTTWGTAGSLAVLGFNASGGPWESGTDVSITADGLEWGLTENWSSVRPAAPIPSGLRVLAFDDAGYPAAWVKHYVNGDTHRGFVRTYDANSVHTERATNVDDIRRLAMYPDPVIPLLGDNQNEADDNIIGAFTYPWYGNPGTSGAWIHWQIYGHNPPSTWSAHYAPNYPNSTWDPSTMLYDSGDVDLLRWQDKLMAQSGLDIAISSWWGIGDSTDDLLLPSARICKSVQWCIYYEMEAYADPSALQIFTDLKWVIDRLGPTKNYAKVDGKWLVFVYIAFEPGTAERWRQAKQMLHDQGYDIYINAYGSGSPLDMPDPWDAIHVYNPTQRQTLTQTIPAGDDSASVSPGYWVTDAAPVLSRDLEAFQNAWEQTVTEAAQSRFLLIETWNEWHEGSCIEPGQRVVHDDVNGFSPTGDDYGLDYIDAIAEQTNTLRWNTSGHRPDVPVTLEAETMVWELGSGPEGSDAWRISSESTRIGASVQLPFGQESNLRITVRARGVQVNGQAILVNMVLFWAGESLTTWTLNSAEYGLYEHSFSTTGGVKTVEIGLANNPIGQGDVDIVVDYVDITWVDCVGDINGSGTVDVVDLLVVIDQWGATDSPADVNQDGIVDVSDLLIVVGNWGPCE